MKAGYIAAGIAALILLGIKRDEIGETIVNLTNEPRGLRANNPLNIRVSDSAWKGKAHGEVKASIAPNETAFEVFIGVEWGIRAAGKLLDTYRNRYGADTIREIITRWAPPSENNTDAYIALVSNIAQMGADELVDRTDYPRILAGMIKMENGKQPFSLDFIRYAVELA